MNQYYNITQNYNNDNASNNLDLSNQQNQSNQFIIKFIGISITYCVSLLVLSSFFMIKMKQNHPKFYRITINDRQV